MHDEPKRPAGLQDIPMEAGFSHRVGGRPLRHPPRDGEIHDPRLRAAGGGQLDHRAGRQASCIAARMPSATSAPLRRWSKPARCCSATPQTRTHASPCAPRKASWLRIRRSAPIFPAPWCMTRPRTRWCVRATTACSTSIGTAVAGPPTRPLPRVQIEQRGGQLYATEWRRDESANPGNNAVRGNSCARRFSRRAAVVAADGLHRGAAERADKNLIPAAAGSTLLLRSMPACFAMFFVSTAMSMADENPCPADSQHEGPAPEALAQMIQ